eukprot:2659624-Alexandrium_andersonii.AAC.1
MPRCDRSGAWWIESSRSRRWPRGQRRRARGPALRALSRASAARAMWPGEVWTAEGRANGGEGVGSIGGSR